MLDFATAQNLVRQQVAPLPIEQLPPRAALGRRLAADVCARGDVPPFSKAMMDGYALRAASFTAPGCHLRLVTAIMAGDQPAHALGPGETAAIMTGAPLPAGADSVVMREHATRSSDGHLVRIDAARVPPGQHVLTQAAVFSAGQAVIPAGTVLSAPTLGLVLECGARTVSVFRQPHIHIVTTGQELCPADQEPGPGQIRNTNGPLLAAMLEPYGTVDDLGIVGDDLPSLRSRLGSGLAGDILVVTGGVSSGDLDLVPGVLSDLGVQQIFHKVALKPGKPVWFGVSPRSRSQPDARPCLVFGLPGNPVSALACCTLFVYPAIRYLAGGEQQPFPRGVLTTAQQVRGDRPTFWPAAIHVDSGQVLIHPLSWLGSADQRCLAAANGLAYFPQGDQTYRAGENIEYVPLAVW